MKQHCVEFNFGYYFKSSPSLRGYSDKVQYISNYSGAELRKAYHQAGEEMGISFSDWPCRSKHRKTKPWLNEYKDTILGPEQLDILQKLFKIYPFHLEWEDFEDFDEGKRQLKIWNASEIMEFVLWMIKSQLPDAELTEVSFELFSEALGFGVYSYQADLGY